MDDRTKRVSAIVAVLASVLAIAVCGYWLGRRSVPAAPVKTPLPTQTKPPDATRMATVAKPKVRVAAEASALLSAAALPVKWRFAGISQYRTGDDTESWLAQFAAHHELIERFNRRHPYAWNVNSPAQIAWLAQNGFPLPEDVIAAETISDDDLRHAADAGSGKALMFYYERLESEVIDAGRAAMTNGATLSDVLDLLATSMASQQQELGRISLPYRRLESPFVGYIEANRPFLADDESIRQQNLASGLALAYARGDERAALSIDATAANHQMPDDWAALAHQVMNAMRNDYASRSHCSPSSTPFPE